MKTTTTKSVEEHSDNSPSPGEEEEGGGHNKESIPTVKEHKINAPPPGEEVEDVRGFEDIKKHERHVKTDDFRFRIAWFFSIITGLLIVGSLILSVIVGWEKISDALAVVLPISTSLTGTTFAFYFKGSRERNP